MKKSKVVRNVGMIGKYKKIASVIERKFREGNKKLNHDVSINQLINDDMVHLVKKGWLKFRKGKVVRRNFSEQLMLVVTELAEAEEEYRNNHGFNEMYFLNGKPEGIPVEIADAFIRLAGICGEFGINVVPAIRTKMSYNEHRPIRHGGKKA